MPKLKLTKASVDFLPYTEKGQVMYTDTDLRGFAVVVGTSTKAYIAQKDIRGRTRRITIGRHGTWTTEMARKEAQQLLVEMDRGIDPVEQKKIEAAERITFGEAFHIHIEKLKRLDRNPRTIEDYHEYTRRYIRDWLTRPIREITRSDIRERHTRIGEKHGRPTANRTMAAFRAIYNTMLKEHESFPVNPTIAVHWYKEYRRQAPIPDDGLKDWLDEVMRLPSPVRRDLQLFMLFTGLRRTDACHVRWEDLNTVLGTLHRPNPKGGPSRAFTIPLPDVCLELLKRRQRDNAPVFGEDCPWVFPSIDRKGGNVIPVKEPREARYNLPSPHRLRDTYTTAANSAGLSPYDIDVLTNHRPPQGSVTSGYIRQDVSHLRLQQQKVADYLKEKMKWHEVQDSPKFAAPMPTDRRTVGNLTPVVLCGNITAPAWWYDWVDEYGGMNRFRKPEDFIIEHLPYDSHHNAVYSWKINGVNVFSLPTIAAGEFLIFPKEIMENIEYTKPNSKELVPSKSLRETPHDITLHFNIHYQVKLNNDLLIIGLVTLIKAPVENI